uniref:Uncharacterized protein n=1 Tax=Arion vulgaris TaxID=1028688 RepID=A0A0B7BDT3_9EUPU
MRGQTGISLIGMTEQERQVLKEQGEAGNNNKLVNRVIYSELSTHGGSDHSICVKDIICSECWNLYTYVSVQE